MSNTIVFPNRTAFITGIKAAVTFSNSKNLFEVDNSQNVKLPGKLGEKYGKIVPRGSDNKLPATIIDKVSKSEVLSANMNYNITIGYGDGITPVFIEHSDTGAKVVRPYETRGKFLRKQMQALRSELKGLEASESKYDKETSTELQEDLAELKKQYDAWKNTWDQVNRFFKESDLDQFTLELLTDINYFYDGYSCLVSNLDSGNNRKIAKIKHMEAKFARLQEMDKEGLINTFFYSAKWADSPKPADIIDYPFLDSKNPAADLLLKFKEEKKTPDKRDNEFVMQARFPTPGRVYYPKPYWWAIIESGWYDFAVSIVEFKKYILKNGMLINYHIELSEDYFDIIFAKENITEEEKKNERVKKEYMDFENYVKGEKNAGKSLISFVKYAIDGTALPRVKITVLDNKLKGGEYIDDSEEASNMMSYVMGVHPNLIGAAPGKNKQSTSGTDKRELFEIKQALLKPVRDIVCKPLYVVKTVNNWDPALHFVIPNIVLTTLDAGKNAKMVTS